MTKNGRREFHFTKGAYFNQEALEELGFTFLSNPDSQMMKVLIPEHLRLERSGVYWFLFIDEHDNPVVLFNRILNLFFIRP